MFRSHHDKIVIVDNKICFIGGLDLCFGRYDTLEHKVGDYPVHTWPGKDYYNPRYVPYFLIIFFLIKLDIIAVHGFEYFQLQSPQFCKTEKIHIRILFIKDL